MSPITGRGGERIDVDEPTLDEACDLALERLNSRRLTQLEADDLVYDCENGHFDCTYREGGPCFNAAIAEAFGVLKRERGLE